MDEDVRKKITIKELMSANVEKKEHDQRRKEVLRFECKCGGGHFIEFDFDDDEYPMWGYEINYIHPFETGDFMYKVKKALAYVFKKEKLYISDVELTKDDLKKLKKHIDQYLKL